jgi:hypothetical protein
MTTYRKSGDIRPPINATLTRPEDGSAVDISGSSAITIYARDPDGTLELTGATAAMVSDGTDGAVEYTVSSGDFAVSGEYDVEWEVDWDGAGDTERFPKKNYQTVKVSDELSV